jgi:hypothetical protein
MANEGAEISGGQRKIEDNTAVEEWTSPLVPQAAHKKTVPQRGPGGLFNQRQDVQEKLKR